MELNSLHGESENDVLEGRKETIQNSIKPGIDLASLRNIAIYMLHDIPKLKKRLCFCVKRGLAREISRLTTYDDMVYSIIYAKSTRPESVAGSAREAS